MRQVKNLSLVQLEKIMGDDDYVVGYCELHEEPVNQRTFEYKGCWTCWNHFRWENWPYIDVRGAAEMYGVCRNTVYGWIKQGKLKARLFVMGRRNANVPRKFYAILPNQPRPRIRGKEVSR